MSDSGGHLTTQDVADQYRVSTMTVRRWVKAGHLAAIRLPGGQLRFKAEDVNAIAEQTGVAS